MIKEFKLENFPPKQSKKGSVSWISEDRLVLLEFTEPIDSLVVDGANYVAVWLFDEGYCYELSIYNSDGTKRLSFPNYIHFDGNKINGIYMWPCENILKLVDTFCVIFEGKKLIYNEFKVTLDANTGNVINVSRAMRV